MSEVVVKEVKVWQQLKRGDLQIYTDGSKDHVSGKGKREDYAKGKQR